MSIRIRRAPDARARDWLDLASLLDPVGIFDSAPSRSPHEWRHLYRFATEHLVGPSLYAILAARGRLHWLPDEIRDALEVLHALNAERNQRLSDLLLETTALLNAAGIEPIVLKGAMALLPGQYAQAEARVLGDLDLGVGVVYLPRSVDTLKAAGFDLPANIHSWHWSRIDWHQAPALMHPSRSGCVELHRWLLGRRVPAQALSLDLMAQAATTLDWHGVRLRVPSVPHRLVHNSLHHQVQDEAFDSDHRALRQMYEFAQLRMLAVDTELD
ncbi:MAG: hypothetical protein EOM24_20325, partial [Chloroflexia bacterium]|nr:hypothetical protein [Chloroflexia bacterium]